VAPNPQSNEPCAPLPESSKISRTMEDLMAFCLLAKLWGKSLTIPLIISKTKLDWKHVKGPVEYIELGNGWVLLRFATMVDKEYV